MHGKSFFILTGDAKGVHTEHGMARPSANGKFPFVPAPLFLPVSVRGLNFSRDFILNYFSHKNKMDDEKLTAVVRSRPCIYEKADKNHFNHDITAACWENMARELGAECKSLNQYLCNTCTQKWYRMYTVYLQDFDRPAAKRQNLKGRVTHSPSGWRHRNRCRKGQTHTPASQSRSDQAKVWSDSGFACTPAGA